MLTRRKKGIDCRKSLKISLGALAGAAIGSIALDWFFNPMTWLEHGDNFWALILQGKSVVGGLLGGLAGVELTKKSIRYDRSTGDYFVFPLIIGMIIGRMGCFFTGLQDDTFGNPTSLPWGIDFGDGFKRHPTQIYDIVFLLVLAIIIYVKKYYSRYEEGDLFKSFMVGYLSFRFMIDFLKPYPKVFVGLNVIQVACLAGLAYYGPFIRRSILAKRRTVSYAEPPLSLS